MDSSSKSQKVTETHPQTLVTFQKQTFHGSRKMTLIDLKPFLNQSLMFPTQNKVSWDSFLKAFISTYWFFAYSTIGWHIRLTVFKAKFALQLKPLFSHRWIPRQERFGPNHVCCMVQKKIPQGVPLPILLSALNTKDSDDSDGPCWMSEYLLFITLCFT